MAATFEILVKTMVGALELYSAAGLLFAIAFVAYGLQRLDLQAKGTISRIQEWTGSDTPPVINAAVLALGMTGIQTQGRGWVGFLLLL